MKEEITRREKRAVTKGAIWRKVQRNKTIKENFGYEQRKSVEAWTMGVGRRRQENVG